MGLGFFEIDGEFTTLGLGGVFIDLQFYRCYIIFQRLEAYGRDDNARFSDCTNAESQFPLSVAVSSI